MKKVFTSSLLLLLFAIPASAQLNTQGKDFWVGLMQNVNPLGSYEIYISAKEACSGTITNPGTGYTKSFTVAANSVTNIPIPGSEIYCTVNETVRHYAVHVEATDTISVFALNKATQSSDASFFIPTPALGSTYTAITYATLSSFVPSETMIIGVEDNTEIEIIPSINSTGGMIAGNTYTITLNKGETYMFSCPQDMTGSIIRTKDENARIAVLSGVYCTNVPLGCSACDHIFEAVLPMETWGKSFYCAPLRNKRFDIFRIVASANNCIVNIGTDTKNLNAGQFFDTTIYAKPIYVTSNQPVAVMGYVGGHDCNNWTGDPDMYWVVPIEQMLYDLVFSTVKLPAIDSEYVNIVVNTADTAYVRVNGQNISPTFRVDPDLPQFAYSQYWLTSNIYNLRSEKGFTAVVYGSGNTSYDSYAYSAGSSVLNLQNRVTVNDIPRNDGDTLEICPHTAYKFGVSGPGMRIWDFGDGDTVHRKALFYAFADTGYHTIYAYTLPQPGFAPDTVRLVIHVNPLCIELLLKDTLICQGQAVNLFAKSSTPRIEQCRRYSWYDGSTLIGTGTPAVSPTVTTTYTLFAANICTGHKDTAYLTVTVRDPVTVSLRPDTTICKGQRVRLKALAAGGDSSYTFTWTAGVYGSGYSDTAVAPTLTTAYAVIADDGCTSGTDTAYTSIYVRPELQVTLPADTILCAGDTITLRAAAAGGDSLYHYKWLSSTHTSDTLTVIVHKDTTLGIQLTDECRSTPDTAWVTLGAEAFPQINIAFDTAICLGDSIGFTNNTIGGNSYLWDFGDLYTSNLKNPTHLYTQAGAYILSLMASSAHLCRDSFQWKFINVYPFPTAAFTSSPEITDLLNPVIEFKNNSSGNGAYTWLFGDMAGSSQKDPQHTYTDTGWYEVILIVTGSHGCADSAYGRVHIIDPFKLFIPNAFSPNGDNINDAFEVKGVNISQYHINIFNRWGEKIFEADNIQQSWDGKMPGQKQASPDNVYYYTIDVRTLKREPHYYRGTVTLVK